MKSIRGVNQIPGLVEPCSLQVGISDKDRFGRDNHSGGKL